MIALQDHEWRLEPRMPTGESITDPYIEDMFNCCERKRGVVFVYEIGGEVAGFVTVQTRVTGENIDDGDLVYGLVSDIIVLPEFQSRGYWRQLLDKAIKYSRNNGVKHLSISVMAQNTSAVTLYRSVGFTELYRNMKMTL